MNKTALAKLKQQLERKEIDHVYLAKLAEDELFYKSHGKNIILHIIDNVVGKQPDSTYEDPIIGRDETMIYYVEDPKGCPVRFVSEVYFATINKDGKLECTAECGDLKYLEDMHGIDSAEVEAYRKGGWNAVEKLPLVFPWEKDDEVTNQ